MADGPDNRNGETEPLKDRIRRSADGAVLTFVARWAMVVTLPLVGFMAAAIYTKLDKTAESTARLEEKVTALIERQIPALNLQLDGRFNSLSDRITGHDRRLDRLEDWRNATPARGTP
jgi:hypothetical protein